MPCPVCGADLKPARELAEIVGYRAITDAPSPVPGTRPEPAVGDLDLHRRVADARARLFQESAEFDGALAEAIALPDPDRDRLGR